MKAKPYLREIRLSEDVERNVEEYPFNIPAVRTLSRLPFHPDVTFLVGENGTGKSTLIEAIALAMGFGPEGGTRNVRVATAQTTSDLHRSIKVVKSYKQPRDFYFLRAESFYNVATYMEETGYLRGYGDKSLHERSHGEAFLATLTIKLRGNGLYLFDEPEAALSPARQMTALAAIHQLVTRDSQFIIATHSPILMAYPRATIYLLGDHGIREVAYEDTEHYSVTLDFLRNHKRMVEYLMDES